MKQYYRIKILHKLQLQTGIKIIYTGLRMASATKYISELRTDTITSTSNPKHQMVRNAIKQPNNEQMVGRVPKNVNCYPNLNINKSIINRLHIPQNQTFSLIRI